MQEPPQPQPGAASADNFTDPSADLRLVRPEGPLAPGDALALARRNLQRLVEREKQRERAREREAAEGAAARLEGLGLEGCCLELSFAPALVEAVRWLLAGEGRMAAALTAHWGAAAETAPAASGVRFFPFRFSLSLSTVPADSLIASIPPRPVLSAAAIVTSLCLYY